MPSLSDERPTNILDRLCCAQILRTEGRMTCALMFHARQRTNGEEQGVRCLLRQWLHDDRSIDALAVSLLQTIRRPKGDWMDGSLRFQYGALLCLCRL